MKFGIETMKSVTKTDIRGKVLDENVWFVVYRSYLFGLIRLYVKITPQKGWHLAYEVTVEYCPSHMATEFEEYEDAEKLIEKMQTNPSKFVRYK